MYYICDNEKYSVWKKDFIIVIKRERNTLYNKTKENAMNIKQIVQAAMSIKIIRHVCMICFQMFLRIYQLLFLKRNVIQKYWTKFDGVEFYLVEDFYQMDELLIEGRVVPSIIAEFFMYEMAGNSSGYTIKFGGCQFVYVAKGHFETSFGTFILAHEVCHILNHHYEKLFYGEYDGLNYEVVNGDKVVVYDFEAQADAYAFKVSGEEPFYSDENFDEFKRKLCENAIRSVEQFEDMFGEDEELTARKNEFLDEKEREIIFSSFMRQFDMRKKLLPKYLK
jgi:hypothetical protein